MSDDDLLPISTISSHRFCPRQVWLARVEQLRAPSTALAEGQALHAAPDPAGDEVLARELTVSSERHGIIGRIDRLVRRDGRLLPVEIKRGARPGQPAHHVQLALLALCLEEMVGVPVPWGEIQHGPARAPEPVPIDAALRAEALTALAETRATLARPCAPPAVPTPACAGCSLEPLCLPRLCAGPSARAALRRLIPEAP